MSIADSKLDSIWWGWESLSHSLGHIIDMRPTQCRRLKFGPFGSVETRWHCHQQCTIQHSFNARSLLKYQKKNLQHCWLPKKVKQENEWSWSCTLSDSWWFFMLFYRTQLPERQIFSFQRHWRVKHDEKGWYKLGIKWNGADWTSIATWQARR